MAIDQNQWRVQAAQEYARLQARLDGQKPLDDLVGPDEDTENLMSRIQTELSVFDADGSRVIPTHEAILELARQAAPIGS